MKNQKNVVIAALTAVLLAIAVLLYASPYIALHSIKKALDNKDTAALSQFVNYPVLRENMKAKLMSSMGSKLPSAATSSDNPLANIGQAIGGMVIGVGYRNDAGEYELVAIESESWVEAAGLPFDELGKD